MVTRAVIIKNSFQDSVKLMQLAEQVRKLPGINRASAIMGTEGNKATLAVGGLAVESISLAGPNDIVMVVQGKENAVEDALIRFGQLLDEKIKEGHSVGTRPRTISSAKGIVSNANLAIISVPSEYVVYEAGQALAQGLNVHIFSDNVPVSEEVRLKQTARELGLLVMGPDCGTSIIQGNPICFANEVAPGPIGIIGASGTGIQEVSTLIDSLGSGITHAIGTGGRDLSDKVGGITTLAAMDLFEDDSETEVIVIISKPPGQMTGKIILDRAMSYRKPVVLAFQGQKYAQQAPNVYSAGSLEEAAALAVALTKEILAEPPYVVAERTELEDIIQTEATKILDKQRYLRGLFSGGSLATEAALIVSESINPVTGNISTPGVNLVDCLSQSQGNSIIDMGGDEFTRGRPHPMIEPEYRCHRLLQEYADPQVAVILCDIVLGHGSHLEPAQALAQAVKKARTDNGRYVSLIANICGTERDPQNKRIQESVLREVGVIVLPTNAYAAQAAAGIVRAIAERR